MRIRAFMIMAGILLAATAAVWQMAGGAPNPPTLAAAAPASTAQTAPVQAPAGTVPFAIDPQASSASYHVGETIFAGNRFNMAVGVTHGIHGNVFVDRAHPDQSRIGPVTVNISQLTSNNGHRDDAIRQHWLESNTYPTATFTATSIQGLPPTYEPGQTLTVRIAGTLTVHNVTKPEVFTGTLQLSGATLTGDLRTTVRMTDFGFDPPSLTVLKAENTAALELQFTAHPLSE
jgi:polyisoprenoid-binding protein YceI